MFFFVHYLVFCCAIFFSVGADDRVQEFQSRFNPSSFGEYASRDQNFDSTIVDDSLPYGIPNQKNYFMDLYSVQTGPRQVEFGHVYENPETWEQRYEKKDHDNKRFQGQARWGDKHGGYGEHYWDYNHGDTNQDDGTTDDVNGSSSLKVQSPSVTSSPLQLQEYVSSSSAPLTSPPSKRKAHRAYIKKRYQNPSKLSHAKPETLEQSSDNEKSTDETNYFQIPKTYSTSEYPLDTDTTIRINNNKNTPYRVDLYEQLKGIPSIYEQGNERYSTVPSYRRISQVSQSTKSPSN